MGQGIAHARHEPSVLDQTRFVNILLPLGRDHALDDPTVDAAPAPMSIGRARHHVAGAQQVLHTVAVEDQRYGPTATLVRFVPARGLVHE